MLRDIGRIFHDLENLAVGVEDRIVTRLYPDFLAGFADLLVLAGIEFAAAELLPEGAVFGALAIGRFHEHAVMLTAHLVERITKRFQEVFIGVNDLAIGGELNHRL